MLDRNVIGVGVIVLVVIASICVIFFANRAAEQEKVNQEYEQFRRQNNLNEDNNVRETTGGSTDKYSWDQSHDAVDVVIPLTPKFDPPPSVREIDVSIKARYLKVTIRREVYFEGYFYDKVNAEDSCWTLERDVDNTILALSIIKAQPSSPASDSDLWPCLLDGEPHINLPRKRMPSVEALDPSDPAAVKRAMKALKKN